MGEEYSYRQVLRDAEAAMERAGVPEADISAWMLMERAAGMDRAGWFLHSREEMPEEARALFLQLVEKRCRRIPLQHILGEAWFMGFPFRVDSRVLIPRPDTENLVERILDRQKKGSPGCSGSALDMCTGSGCIAVSLKKLGGFQEVWAADISEDALALARENAGNNGCPDIRFVASDLFSALPGKRFDVIACNPPYIPTGEIDSLMPEVRDFDPRLALDGDLDGLAFYRRLAREVPQHLKEGGWLFLEIGYDQGRAVEKLLGDAGFSEVRILRDDAGQERIAEARMQGTDRSGSRGKEEAGPGSDDPEKR